MKFFLFAVIFFGFAGSSGCVKPSNARAEAKKVAPLPINESITQQQRSSEYFQNTMNDARDFVLTEDPRVWMRAMQGGY